MSTPYIGFGNDTLAKLPAIREGDPIACNHCGGEHPLEYGTSNGKKSNLLGFYKCGESSYLAAVGGKLVTNRKPDVSGAMPAQEGVEKDG